MGAGFSATLFKSTVLVVTVAAATDRATDATHVARRLDATEQVLTASDSAVLVTELTYECQVCADVIVLGDGTYTSTGTYAAFRIRRDVTLRAQNLHGAVLDGENARRVMLIEMGHVSPTVVIEGLVITNGNANTGDRVGGGVYIKRGTTSTFTSCEISSNTAETNGGGMYIEGALVTVEQTTISGNTVEGRMEFSLERMEMALVGGDGGGVHVTHYLLLPSTVFFLSTTITGNHAGNQGGGVYVNDNGGTVSLVFTTVLPNSCDGATCSSGSFKSSSATLRTVDIPSATSATCDAGTFLNTTTATCQISSPCSTAVSDDVAASPSTLAGPPTGLLIEDPNAKIMFGQGPDCTIQLDAGKLVSSCQIMEPNSGRRLQEHAAEVSSLTTKNDALTTENDALKAKIALLEAAK